VLGSLKGNLGNLDAAAGVVGLLKAALAVRHGRIPPTLHYTAPHPEVDLAAGPIEVSATVRDWPGPRQAGVSSFGLGGTNAHVLLEEGPVREPRPAVAGPVVLPLSAATPEALRALADGLARHLAAAPATDLGDVAYTLAVGRRRLACRAAVTAQSGAGAVAGLRAVVQGPAAPAAPAALCHLGEGAPPPSRSPQFPESPAGRRISLPGYPFRRRRHWIEPRQ
jgi:acyl transferase domain-containing protein